MNEVQSMLKELNDKGWTDAAIADELEVSHMTVFRWQKGLRSAQNSRSVLYSLNALLERKRIPKRKRRVSQNANEMMLAAESLPDESIMPSLSDIADPPKARRLLRKGYLDTPRRKNEQTEGND